MGSMYSVHNQWVRVVKASHKLEPESENEVLLQGSFESLHLYLHSRESTFKEPPVPLHDDDHNNNHNQLYLLRVD